VVAVVWPAGPDTEKPECEANEGQETAPESREQSFGSPVPNEGDLGVGLVVISLWFWNHLRIAIVMSGFPCENPAAGEPPENTVPGAPMPLGPVPVSPQNASARWSPLAWEPAARGWAPMPLAPTPENTVPGAPMPLAIDYVSISAVNKARVSRLPPNPSSPAGPTQDGQPSSHAHKLTSSKARFII